MSTIRVEFTTAGVNGTSVLPGLHAKVFSFNEIAPCLKEAFEGSGERRKQGPAWTSLDRFGFPFPA
jgi:hypothetical protein